MPRQSENTERAALAVRVSRARELRREASQVLLDESTRSQCIVHPNAPLAGGFGDVSHADVSRLLVDHESRASATDPGAEDSDALSESEWVALRAADRLVIVIGLAAATADALQIVMAHAGLVAQWRARGQQFSVHGRSRWLPGFSCENVTDAWCCAATW